MKKKRMPIYGGKPGALPPMETLDGRNSSAPTGSDPLALKSVTRSESEYNTLGHGVSQNRDE